MLMMPFRFICGKKELAAHTQKAHVLLFTIRLILTIVLIDRPFSAHPQDKESAKNCIGRTSTLILRRGRRPSATSSDSPSWPLRFGTLESNLGISPPPSGGDGEEEPRHPSLLPPSSSASTSFPLLNGTGHKGEATNDVTQLYVLDQFTK